MYLVRAIARYLTSTYSFNTLFPGETFVAYPHTYLSKSQSYLTHMYLLAEI